jgi:hypothetical protein
LPLLRQKLEQNEYSTSGILSQDNREGKRSKNVLPSRSKNVSPRRRRTSFKDSQTLRKISTFSPSAALAPASSGVSSSVVHPTPLHTHPSTPCLTPSNDNRIPVWALTGDTVKAVIATGALVFAETPAVAFTFNLTPEAIEKAKGQPAGFLDSLKRSWDKELKRAFGSVFPYLFAIDIEDGRLHIHGAFLPPAMSLRTIRKIRATMKDAWGKQEGPGARKQLRFKKLFSDDWAFYFMRNRRKVAKIIGPRTFTITRPLQRDAQRVYSEIRRIMREG